VLLAGVAARTRRAAGTGVLRQHTEPGSLAQVTLDQVARTSNGIGISRTAWDRRFDAIGIPFSGSGAFWNDELVLWTGGQ
jgi:hypothetical protein